MQLRERTAFITGGGSGIGLAIASRFLDSGASVAIASRRGDLIAATVQKLSEGRGKIFGWQLDIRQREMVEIVLEQAAQRLGRIDILVNNAGLGGSTPLNSGEEGLWEAIIDTNVHGTYWCTRAALRHMPDRQDGCIINISSVLGKMGAPAYSAYAASKHAVLGMTRALALELAPRGIRVNAICPGWVETEMAEQGIREIAGRLGKKAGEVREMFLSQIPQRRFLSPGEVADLALYLASPEAGGMTGQTVVISNGSLMD